MYVYNEASEVGMKAWKDREMRMMNFMKLSESAVGILVDHRFPPRARGTALKLV